MTEPNERPILIFVTLWHLLKLTELSTEEEVIPTAVVDGLLRHGWLMNQQEQVGLLCKKMWHILKHHMSTKLVVKTYVMMWHFDD